MAYNGWADALGAAILSGNKMYREATLDQRQNQRLDREQQRQEEELKLRQQQAEEQMQNEVLQRAILKRQIDNAPRADAQQRVDQILKVQGVKGSYDNPAFVQANADAGTPLRIDPSFAPNALPAKPVGDLATAATKRQNMLRSDTTGALYPDEVSEADINKQNVKDAQAHLMGMFKPGTPEALEVQFNAAGIKPPASLLRDPAQDVEVKTVKDMLGNERLVTVNKRAALNGAQAVMPVAGGAGGAAPTPVPGGSSAPSAPADQELTGDDFLKTLDPKTASIVKQLSQYRYPVGQGMGATKMLLAYAPLVAAYDPTWTAADYANRQKLMQNYSSGPRAQIATSIDQVLHHLQSLQQSGAALHNVSLPFGTPQVNAVKNWFATEAGSAAPNNARMNAQAVASELAKVYKGTGATGEKEIAEWLNSVDFNAMSPEQQQGVISKGVELLNGALTAHRDTFARGMGKPMDFSLISPQQQQFIDKYLAGKAPMAAAPTSAAPAPIVVNTPQGAFTFDSPEKAAAFKQAAGIQ